VHENKVDILEVELPQHVGHPLCGKRVVVVRRPDLKKKKKKSSSASE